MKTIPLTNGGEAIVDDADVTLLSRYGWFRSGRYAFGNVDGHLISMHRFLLKPAKGIMIDHINAHPLDNRRSNLRECSRSQNWGNARKRRGNSPYKGVWHDVKRKRFEAGLGGVKLGRFKDEKDAALAYNAAAIDKWGSFAHLNAV